MSADYVCQILWA